MLIEVISTVDDTKGLVDASLLELLIKNGTLKAFKREHAWVTIGEHDIRQSGSGYTGPERRKIEQLAE